MAQITPSRDAFSRPDFPPPPCLFVLFRVRICSVPHFECRIRPEAKCAKRRAAVATKTSERSFHLRPPIILLRLVPVFGIAITMPSRCLVGFRVLHRKNGLPLRCAGWTTSCN